MVRYGTREFISYKRKYLVAVTHPTKKSPITYSQLPIPNPLCPILNYPRYIVRLLLPGRKLGLLQKEAKTTDSDLGVCVEDNPSRLQVGGW